MKNTRTVVLHTIFASRIVSKLLVPIQVRNMEKYLLERITTKFISEFIVAKDYLLAASVKDIQAEMQEGTSFKTRI